jgi:hypothetical protein
LIRIKAVYLDGSEEETSAGARAEVEFERKFNMAFADAFHPRVKGEPRGRQEWQYFLTWASLELEDGAFDFSEDKERDAAFNDWLKRVDTIDVLGSAAADPTKRDRRPADSSSSAS